MKQQKKNNPYEKKQKRSLRLSRTQWIAIISVLATAAIIAGIALAARAGGTDPHAGHNHGNLPDGHYEGDGHNHGTPTSANDTKDTAKVKYQVYTNADKTYRLVFRNDAGKTVAEFDKVNVLEGRSFLREAVDETQGLYELGWATGDGPNDVECIYYNEKTGQVSKKYVAPRGTDGVRIAYPNEKETGIIVEDLFNDKGYSKEYALEGATPDKNGNIITGGQLRSDKKTVVVSYHADDKDGDSHAVIKLYE